MSRRSERPSPRPTDLRWIAAIVPWLLGCDPAPPDATADVAPGSPLADLAPPEAAEERWSGIVEQSVDAKPYTYLAVRDEGALRWVAIMGPAQPPGAKVAIRTLGVQRAFHSRRLDRTFDELVFGEIEDGQP